MFTTFTFDFTFTFIFRFTTLPFILHYFLPIFPLLFKCLPLFYFYFCFCFHFNFHFDILPLSWHFTDHLQHWYQHLNCTVLSCTVKYFQIFRRPKTNLEIHEITWSVACWCSLAMSFSLHTLFGPCLCHKHLRGRSPQICTVCNSVTSKNQK